MAAGRIDKSRSRKSFRKKDASICGWARDLGRLSHPCFTIVSRMAPEKRLGFHAARMKPLKSFSV
jgi:hypothetical protein